MFAVFEAYFTSLDLLSQDCWVNCCAKDVSFKKSCKETYNSWAQPDTKRILLISYFSCNFISIATSVFIGYNLCHKTWFVMQKEFIKLSICKGKINNYYRVCILFWLFIVIGFYYHSRLCANLRKANTTLWPARCRCCRTVGINRVLVKSKQ